MDNLIALLLKTPILQNFDKEKNIDFTMLNQYIENHKTDKGILLIRRYYGITAHK